MDYLQSTNLVEQFNLVGERFQSASSVSANILVMDITWSDAVLSLGIGVGLAAATGMRVFLPLLVLGTAARMEWLPLSGGFEWLASWPAIVALAVAAILEVGAYYVPLVDNFLDVLAGPLAVLAGIVATAAVITDLPPLVRWSVAIVAGGGTAGIVQTVMSVLRLKSTTFTAGVGNFMVASVELAGSFVASIVAILAPAIAFVVVTECCSSFYLFLRIEFLPVAKRRDQVRRLLPSRFLIFALTKVVRTVLQAVRRRDLVCGLLLRELQLRNSNRFQFLCGAIGESNLFTRHKEDLSNRHGMRAREPFPWLQHVAEL